MDATSVSGASWILAGIAWMVFRTIGRVEALEKEIRQLRVDLEEGDRTREGLERMEEKR